MILYFKAHVSFYFMLFLAVFHLDLTRWIIETMPATSDVSFPCYVMFLFFYFFFYEITFPNREICGKISSSIDYIL